MPFEFSLAAVLRHRGMVEEREERLLQGIVLELGQTIEKLADTNRRITESYASIGRAPDRATVGHEVHAAYGEASVLIEQRKELEARILKLEELRDKQRVVYETARRDREVLSEMHKERRKVYDAEVTRREQRFLDDNYNARRGRS